MKILKFKKTINDKYKIALDNNTTISLYEDVIINNNLLLTKTIEEDELDDLLRQNNDIYVYSISLNYISIRQALKYLELMTKLWQVPKSNIVIIINKYQRNSLDKYQIESFFSEYKILDFVNYNPRIEGFENGINFNIDYGINKDAIYNDLGMIEVKNKPKSIISSVINFAESRLS